MEEVQQVFTSKYFKFIYFLLSINGFWPFQTQIIKQMIRTVILSVDVMAIIMTIYSIIVYCGDRNLSFCTENIVSLCYFLGFLAKYGITILYESKMIKLYKYLAHNWLNITDPIEHRIMCNYIKRCNFVNLLYILYMSLGGIVFFIVSIANPILDTFLPLNESRQRYLIQQIASPVDPDEYFYYIVAMYTPIIIITICGGVTVDAIYSTNIHQSVAVFAVIKCQLQKAVKIKDKDASYFKIISIIKLHQSVIELINEINSTFQNYHLMLIGCTLIGFGVGTITVLENMHDKLLLFRLILFFVGTILHMLFLNYQGQIVIDHSWDLYSYLFTIHWFKLPKKTVTILKVMMIRCLKPCVLTAAGLFILSNENFSKILKTALSYATVAFQITLSNNS